MEARPVPWTLAEEADESAFIRLFERIGLFAEARQLPFRAEGGAEAADDVMQVGAIGRRFRVLPFAVELLLLLFEPAEGVAGVIEIRLQARILRRQMTQGEHLLGVLIGRGRRPRAIRDTKETLLLIERATTAAAGRFLAGARAGPGG